MTNYDDWITKVLSLVERLVIKISDLKILKQKVGNKEKIDKKEIFRLKRIISFASMQQCCHAGEAEEYCMPCGQSLPQP